jgi:shikimate dehydrogenase
VTQAVESNAKRACVIGWPIEQSRSPLIHGYWLKTYGIAGFYDRMAVPPGEAAAFIRSLESHGLEGCNVTAPHKQAVFEAADWRDPSAEAVGAANTVWRDGAKVCVANTDTYGFMTHLGQSAPGWDRKDAPVVIFGAGGAARAIVYGFLDAGIDRVRLINRTAERAESLVAHFGTRVESWGWTDRARAVADAGVIVNTTTLGMVGNAPLDLDLAALDGDAIVADIVYVPLSTPLLAEAQARGHRTVDGLGMLLHQAVPGFARWFGVKPEVTRELRDILVADIERK